MSHQPDFLNFGKTIYMGALKVRSAGRKTILEDEDLELFAIRFLVVDRDNAQEIGNILQDSGVPVNYPA